MIKYKVEREKVRILRRYIDGVYSKETCDYLFKTIESMFEDGDGMLGAFQYIRDNKIDFSNEDNQKLILNLISISQEE